MSLRRPTVASLLFIISPFRDVAQTSDCGIAVIYFHYKPFPRCRIDVRLWHALSFTFQYKPFMWCRPDARLRHVNLFVSPFVASLQTPDRFLVIFFGISGRLPPDFLLFIMLCKFTIWVCIANCSWCIVLHLLYLMSELSCEYIQSTHLACWFGQMLTKVISWMKSTIASPTPRGVPVSPVRSWIWSLVFYMLPPPK